MKLTPFTHNTPSGKTSHLNHCQPGFASTLTVISIGLGLLLILFSMYENTIEAQNTQKDHMLRADYQQREEAFLRAMTNIIPNNAIICMQDQSYAGSTRNNYRWSKIYADALDLSNSEQTLTADRANDLALDQARSANTANTSAIRDQDIVQNIVIPTYGETARDISASTHPNRASSSNPNRNYPPPLKLLNRRFQRDGNWPLVSFQKSYSDNAVGWVGADVIDYPLYNLVDAPSLHFNYSTGDQLIAKHNWWAFSLSLAANDQDATDINVRTKDYLVSLYEIPAQLSINATSFATLGTHSDGSSWTNVSIQGGVFAERVRTEGSFSSESIASRTSVEVSDATVINGAVTGGNLESSNPFAGNARELSQSQGETFPISSASNGGRVSFVPINRGLDFYDRFASNLTNNSSSSDNGISETAWDYYSMGAQQCVMRVDIIGVVSDTDQTPTSIRFTYGNNSDGSSLTEEVYTRGDNWPQPGTPDGDLFPFHVVTSATDIICLAVYAQRIQPFLASNGADFPEVNRSLSISPDYVNSPDPLINSGIIQKPSFPALDTDTGVLLFEAEDLSVYTRGFSLVTNMKLILGSDVNTTSIPTPPGVTLEPGESFFPPLSLFAPEKRFGDSEAPVRIDLKGSLGSLADNDGTTPIRPADLKSGLADEVITDNITAVLTPYTHPAELPPINMMNWMVVITEVHP